MTQIKLLSVPSDLEKCREIGNLLCQILGRPAALPLKSVSMKAHCLSGLSRVNVQQTFINDHKDFIEAVYIFPLSPTASVSKFEMKVGDRVVKGLVKERGEARQDYAQAIESGHRASLLEQERDDVFTVQVGNIKPGEEVSINLEYVELLGFSSDGRTSLRLPTVVAPRYTPGNEVNRDNVGVGVEMDTDIVPDASRITPPRLVPGFEAKTALTINVELEGFDEIGELSCSQHAVKTAFGKKVKVELSGDDELLNRDFILSWQVAGAELTSSAFFEPAQSEAENAKKTESISESKSSSEYFGFVTINPPSLKEEEFYTMPRDIVFLLDRSGSMHGQKMASASSSLSLLLTTLSDRDRFAIAAFDDTVEWMNKRGRYTPLFIKADEYGIALGEKFLRDIQPRGGTEMHGALSSVATLIKDERKRKRQPIVVVITDGEVSDESRILKLVQTELDNARVFCLGIDSSVNAGLLQRMANLGGGTSTLVPPGAELEKALQSIAGEIGVPVLSKIEIELLDKDGKEKEIELAVEKIRDVFEGRPSTVFFRAAKDICGGKLKVSGDLADGSDFEQEINLAEVQEAGLPSIYARTKIMDLEDQYRLVYAGQAVEIKKQIIATSVKHQILSRFTAFVTVDDKEVVNQHGDVRTVVQPVEMPAAWGSPASIAAAGYGAAPQMAASGWGAGFGGSVSTGSYDAIAPQSAAAPTSPAPTSQAAKPGSAPPAERSGSSLMGQLVRQRRADSNEGAGSGPVSPPPFPPPAGQPPSPNQAQAPRPEAGGAWGGLGNIGSAFSGMFQKKENNEAYDKYSDMPKILELVIKLESKLAQLKDKPSDLSRVAEVEALLQEISALLMASGLDFELGRLQAFLKGPLPELLRAYKQSIPEARMKPLLSKTLGKLEEAKKELARGKGQIATEFWNDSI